MRNWAIAAPLAAALLCATATALADDGDSGSPKLKFEWLPGAARAIPRTDSASRDAPVMEYAYGPAAQTTIGAEWAWFLVHGPAATFRTAMYAMLPLENHDSNKFFPPAQLWRGMAGVSVSLSLDEVARRWLGQGGALELSFVLGHESDHGELPNDPAQPDDIPDGGGGDFVTPDLALMIPMAQGRLTAVVRIHARLYIQGALVVAPGGDIILRWKLGKHLVPIAALFAEGIIPRRDSADNGYFVRLMAGIAIPGKIGELTVFCSIDAGNGKGLLVNHERMRMSLGIRYSPFVP